MVSFGTPIVVLSNPKKLEIVVDLLSNDAVKVDPGAPVIVENWGGPIPLRARVRTVEPYGFTQVLRHSGLRAKNQCNRRLYRFTGSLENGYRIDARIVIWESPAVLKIPSSALFRLGQTSEHVCS